MSCPSSRSRSSELPEGQPCFVIFFPAFHCLPACLRTWLPGLLWWWMSKGWWVGNCETQSNIVGWEFKRSRRSSQPPTSSSSSLASLLLPPPPPPPALATYVHTKASCPGHPHHHRHAMHPHPPHPSIQKDPAMTRGQPQAALEHTWRSRVKDPIHVKGSKRSSEEDTNHPGPAYASNSACAGVKPPAATRQLVTTSPFTSQTLTSAALVTYRKSPFKAMPAGVSNAAVTPPVFTQSVSWSLSFTLQAVTSSPTWGGRGLPPQYRHTAPRTKRER